MSCSTEHQPDHSCRRIDPAMRCDNADAAQCCQGTANIKCPCECHLPSKERTSRMVGDHRLKVSGTGWLCVFDRGEWIAVLKLTSHLQHMRIRAARP